MTERKKIVSLGSCYVDINVPKFPLPHSDEQFDDEIVGGDYELVAGGSAVNVCRRLGATGVFAPIFVGMVGRDNLGATLKELLERDGVEARLEVAKGVSTAVSFNMTGEDGGHLMCVAGTANRQLDERAVQAVREQLDDAQFLFLGGLYKLHDVLPHAAELARAARERGVDVVVDHARETAGTTVEQKKHVRDTVLASSIYLPSHDELLETWGTDTVDEAIELISAQAPGLMIAVKNGGSEVQFHSSDERGKVQPPKVDQVVDLTGAGDTFNAYLLAALATGESFRSAVERGCEFASEKVAGRR